MKIIAVSGTKNTGKTTLVTKIVAELTKRSYNVGTVKHTHHKFDTEGRDTWKHKEAGAEIVVGSGNETFFTLQESMDLDTILSILKFIKNPDFVVLESLSILNMLKYVHRILKMISLSQKSMSLKWIKLMLNYLLI